MELLDAYFGLGIVKLILQREITIVAYGIKLLYNPGEVDHPLAKMLHLVSICNRFTILESPQAYFSCRTSSSPQGAHFHFMIAAEERTEYF